VVVVSRNDLDYFACTKLYKAVLTKGERERSLRFLFRSVLQISHRVKLTLLTWAKKEIQSKNRIFVCVSLRSFCMCVGVCVLLIVEWCVCVCVCTVDSICFHSASVLGCNGRIRTSDLLSEMDKNIRNHKNQLDCDMNKFLMFKGTFTYGSSTSSSLC